MLSDGVAWLLRVGLKYRLKVINNNLDKVFGQEQQHVRVEKLKGIYKNLADIILEGIKGLSMSKNQMMSRYVFLNGELLNAYLEKHNQVILSAAHYCNWEWSVAPLTNTQASTIWGVYKKIKNPRIDQFVVRERSKWGVSMIPTKIAAKKILAPTDKKTIIALASDQNPSNLDRAIWVDFLNQKTACLSGPESFSKELGIPVLYGHCKRVKRGVYQVDFEVITENGALEKPTVITQKFMKILEKEIYNNPHNWLWSHKRWKHKPPANQ